MTFQRIEDRCRREIGEYASKKAAAIIEDVARQANIGTSGLSFNADFDRLSKPLRAYLHAKIERDAMSALWGEAEQAALDVVKKTLNNTPPSGQ